MHAISRLSTASEPLVDPSRMEEPPSHEERTKSSLPKDLNAIFPPATWTRAIQDERKRSFPQTIAHRGYKAVYPENTMIAFREAVAAGAHALETDIHLSKDGVTLLSHDKDLKRCFGSEEKIIDCDWEFLSQKRTLAEPHEPMPQLVDLLQYLAQPELQHIWLLLDIKIDNDARDVMRLIAECIKSIQPGSRPWNQRIVLGIWAARYLPLCAQYLPGFSVSNIGFSTSYARQFLQVPNISFNMLQKVLLGPIGGRFIRDAQKNKRQLFFWTVNEVNLMKWGIQKEVDGVITDDPKLFREMCERWDDKEPPAKVSWYQWFFSFYLYFMIIIFWIPFKRRFPESVSTFLKPSDTKNKAALGMTR